MTKGEKGFTMIELILVITLLGILAVVALPRFFNMSTGAQTAAREGVVGSVRSGIALWRANDLVQGNSGSYPTALDSASAGACNTTNPCFGNVLEQGIQDGNWTRNADGTYTHTPTGSTFTYVTAAGTFQ
ncbi:MAG: type II secretion system protein [Deltaproteobacteria bacterium]|nr:type II secretion system protein [Deltaproteobacteria bacterium]